MPNKKDGKKHDKKEAQQSHEEFGKIATVYGSMWPPDIHFNPKKQSPKKGGY